MFVKVAVMLLAFAQDDPAVTLNPDTKVTGAHFEYVSNERDTDTIKLPTWYSIPSGELSTIWSTPDLPAQLLGTFMLSRQNSPMPVVLTIGTISVNLNGGSVSVVPLKLHSPTGWTFWIDTANLSTWTSVELPFTVGVKPPHGDVGSSSSSKPADGGHRRTKCAEVWTMNKSVARSCVRIMNVLKGVDISLELQRESLCRNERAQTLIKGRTEAQGML